MTELGRMYHYGHFVEKDIEKALRYTRRAIDMGNSDAMVLLALASLDGESMPMDVEGAMTLLKKAAKDDNDDALLFLDEMYMSGEFFERDVGKEVKYYTRSARAGNAEAMFTLAGIYTQGDGVEKDVKKGFKWTKAAADEGHARAMYLTGLSCLSGLGVKENYAMAEDAAEEDDDARIDMMEYCLGDIYYYGLTREPDLEEAYRRYRRAARLGYDEAKKMLRKPEFKKFRK